MSKDGMEVLDDRLYTKEHDWIKKEDGGKVKMGITDYAQHQLGEITLMELPNKGVALTKGEEMGYIESAKTSEDLMSPVEGTVLRVNEASALGEVDKESDEDAVCYSGSFEKLKKTPYDSWLIEVALDSEEGLEGLLTPDEYREFIK